MYYAVTLKHLFAYIIPTHAHFFFPALEGYIHHLSEIHTASNSALNYFDCELQIAKNENIRVVCYSPQKRLTMRKKKSRQSKNFKVIETKNCK